MTGALVATVGVGAGAVVALCALVSAALLVGSAFLLTVLVVR